jgi:hypothetical protein
LEAELVSELPNRNVPKWVLETAHDSTLKRMGNVKKGDVLFEVLLKEPECLIVSNLAPVFLTDFVGSESIC